MAAGAARAVLALSVHPRLALIRTHIPTTTRSTALIRSAFEVKYSGSERSEDDSIANRINMITNVQPNGNHGLPSFALATTEPAATTNTQRATAEDLVDDVDRLA